MPNLIFCFILFTLISFPLIGQAEFKKSEFDHREYREFTLDNELRVLIISDFEAIDAAVSLAVRVGGADDPVNRAGMAHLLEHMMFLGTKKYPELDGFRRFIEQHGGQTNAYTSIDTTNYNFSIEPSQLASALDRFSDFFVAPLFPLQQVDRERGVVDAEFQMRTQRDAVRRWAAMRHTYNPKHPAAKFISGTSETLGGDVRGELIEFFESRYSSNLMNLVVLGREPLDVLQAWVENRFSQINNSKAKELIPAEPLFLEDDFPLLLKINSLKDNPSLTLLFPVRDLEPLWRESPDTYISHLLGHEGKGSLLSILKGEGWADALYVSPANAGYNAYSINIRISLTNDGFENWESVAAYVFQYIREVRSRGISEWRFSETKKIDELSYNFSEIDDARSYVTYLASTLHKYPKDEILPALYLVEKYDPELIASILEELNPENVLAILTSQDLETDKVTPFIRAEYSILDISSDTKELWNASLVDSSEWLPKPNTFLPDNIGLKEDTQSEIPERVVDIPGFELWHQTDTSFEVPKASLFVSIRSPVVKNNVTDSVLMSLYTESINDQLNEFAYSALVAGLEYSLYGHSRGLSFRISGYDDKQNLLLERIVDVLKSPKFDDAKFSRTKSELKRSLENRSRDSAYSQTISEFYTLVVEPFWTEEEQLQALDEIQFSSLVEYSKRVLESVEIVVLSHGNVRKTESEAMGQYILENILNPDRVAKVHKNDLINLPEESNSVRFVEINNEDSAIVVYLQGTNRSIQERVKFSLLNQIIQTPFFSELRSVQQLGYVVFSTYFPIARVPGLMFVIQSPNVEPQDMDKAISTFLDGFSDSLDDLSDKDFEDYRNGLINEILEADTTLTERSSRYWTAIDQLDLQFDRLQRVADELSQLQRSDFQNFVVDLLDNKTHARLTVLGYGKSHELPNQLDNLSAIHITDRDAFKERQKLFPPLNLEAD